MPEKKVLIIGAGIAGLSAGSYLQRNGYSTEIYEAHSTPGGLCTAWKRGEYIFDYCIHWLIGTKPDTGFDVVWDELGAFQNEDGSKSRICTFDEFSRVEFADGEIVRLYANADRLKEEFLRVGPGDRRIIEQLTEDLKKLSRLHFTVDTEKRSRSDRITSFFRNLSVMRGYLRHLKTPMQEYAQKYRSQVIRKTLLGITPADWSLATLTMGLGMQHSQTAGYPVGGSINFARNIERKYLSLGGKIHYRHPVEKIIVKDDQAVGLYLESGERVMGDEIISAADGYSTLYKMLEEKFLTEKLRKAYTRFPLFPSSIFLGFGIARDMKDQPKSLALELDSPLELPDKSTHPFLGITLRHYDPTLAPAGKTSASVLLNTWNDTYWRDLAGKDRRAYEEAKKEIENRVIELLEKRFPGIRSDIEVTDVSTPYTVQRYTHNWHGSYEGFGLTPTTFMTRFPKTLPGLSHFSMIGQWTTTGGGLPPAGWDGRNIASKMCKKDGKPFIT
jgi:phytoene dehydrogenase-like protein